MTIHIGHNPDPKHDTPTEQTLRAQHVLESLDTMRNGGATIEDQVRYLHQNLPSAEKQVQEPSTIAERLALQERLRGEFTRLRQAMVGLMTVWNTPDILPDDVRTAGYRLLKHLDGMRQVAETGLTEGWKSEIGMLSEMWEGAPDVSKVFDVSPPRPPHGSKLSAATKVQVHKEATEKHHKALYTPLNAKGVEHEEGMKKVKEAIADGSLTDKLKEAVEKAEDRSKERAEARRLPHKVLHEPLGKSRLDEDLKTFGTTVLPEGVHCLDVKDMDELAEAIHKETLKHPEKIMKAEEERLTRNQQLVKELDNAQSVVGDPSKIKLKLPELRTELPLEPATQLTIETWTAALNELVVPSTMAENHEWTFDNELQGTHGDEERPITVLLWKAPGCHARLRRQSLALGVQVTLQIYMSGVIYDCSELLKTEDDLGRHDCNPQGLIAATLASPTK